MVQDTKFTPGPWMAGEYNIYDDEILIFANGGSYVASVDVDGQQGMASWNGIQADAHLISAAPELFDACDFALTILDGMGNGNGDAAKACRAALSKARGE